MRLIELLCYMCLSDRQHILDHQLLTGSKVSISVTLCICIVMTWISETLWGLACCVQGLTWFAL